MFKLKEKSLIKNITMQLILIAIVAFIVFSYTTVLANDDIKFTDITNHWAKNEIDLLAKEAVIQGYEDGTFRPNNPVTVSEFLKMVVSMGDYKLETIGNRWPDWYIQTTIKNNLINEDEFENYNVYITRYEAAKILGKYIDLTEVSKARKSFKDLDRKEEEIILKLVRLNVVDGYTDNTFKSQNSITRAEACKIIINSYKAKQELLKTRNVELSSKVTNIKGDAKGEIRNTYEINNDRIYIYDSGRYANLNGQKLNQEYIDDKKVIRILKKLSSDESYTELKFVPDKYIINNLNICYGKSFSEVQNGGYIFEIRFYENAYYDVAASKDNSKFMKNACIKIKTGKMWDKQFEYETDISCNEKNLSKLKDVIGIVLSPNVEEEFIEYFKEKRIEACQKINSEEPKISEVKKIGKYTINTFCMRDNNLEFYIEKN